ncbi:hypothetical protein C0431_13950 [bacterium]|nr:hypothetical protein [bacterium]
MRLANEIAICGLLATTGFAKANTAQGIGDLDWMVKSSHGKNRRILASVEELQQFRAKSHQLLLLHLEEKTS